MRRTLPNAWRLLVACLLLQAAGAAYADCVRPGDRVLVVNTRPVGCTTDAERLANGARSAEVVDGRWRSTPLDSLIGSLDPSVPIVFYVHGNQIGGDDARRRGCDVYRQMVRCACDDRPFQFVIFSWCSSKVPGLLKDFRVKAARTRPVGWQFAWLINRMPAGSQIGVLGYSYGARVASGAAHLLAGGSLSGLRLPTEAAGCDACPRVSIRGVFMAAAYDACWNSTRCYHGRSLDTIDSLLSTVDPRDPAMKYFKWVPRFDDPPAMGGVGPRGLDAEQASRVRLMTVTSSVGKSHDLYDYLEAPGLIRSAWRRLTYADQPAGPVVAEVANADELAANRL